MSSAWLILHGHELFRLVLAASLVAGAAGSFPLLRRRARRVARKHARLRASPTEARRFTEGACVTVLGVLDADGTSCPRIEDGAQVAAASIEVPRLPRETARAARLSVLVDGIGVELAAVVDLVHGSTERWARWPLGKLPMRIAERAAFAGLEVGAIPHRRAVLRSLAAGDLVRAAGRLQACAAARETGDYRQAARRWQLVGDEPGAPIAIACARPARVHGSWISRARGAAFAALVTCALATLLGELTYDARDPEVLALAAATPFRRQAAIQRLAWRVGEMREATPAGIDDAFLLARVPRYCDTAATALLSAGDARHAAPLGERCRTDLGWGIAARAWTLLGEPGRASAAATRAIWSLDATSAVRMHLLAGDLRRAADAARRFEASLPACFAQALEARAGDKRALIALEQAAASDQPGRRTCAILLADLLTGHERTAFLDSWLPLSPAGGRRHPSLPERLGAMLMLEANPGRLPPGDLDVFPEVGTTRFDGALLPGDRVLSEANPERLVLEGETELHGVPGLEHSVLERLSSIPQPDDRILALRARLASSQAELESIAGRSDEARALALAAVVDLRALRHVAGRADVAAAIDEAEGLRAAVELRAGAIDRGREALDRVSRGRWFAPLLRHLASDRGTWPLVECAGWDGPVNHCDWAAPASPLGGRALYSATETTTRQLTVTADLARIAARRTWRDRAQRGGRGPGGSSLEGNLRRRTAQLREVLLDRDRAVLLAVLDGRAEIEMESALQTRLPQTIEALLGRTGSVSQLVGWLAHRDMKSFVVRVPPFRCTTFVVAGDPWGMELGLRVRQPVDGRVWVGAPAQNGAAVQVCPTQAGDLRVDVQAGPVSGRYVVGIADTGPIP